MKIQYIGKKADNLFLVLYNNCLELLLVSVQKQGMVGHTCNHQGC